MLADCHTDSSSDTQVFMGSTAPVFREDPGIMCLSDAVYVCSGQTNCAVCTRKPRDLGDALRSQDSNQKTVTGSYLLSG